MFSRLPVSLVILAILALALVACGGGGSGGGGGSEDSFAGLLAGALVVPPVTTANTGNFQVDISSDETTIDITVIHTVADMTAVALHGPAEPGENGPLIFDVLANGTVTRTPGTRGGPEQVRIEAQITEVTQDLLDDIGADLTYLIVSSGTFPQGELRGQLGSEPSEPDVVVQGATMTYIDPLTIEQIEVDAARIVVENRAAESIGIRADLLSSLDDFIFSGDDLLITAPAPGDSDPVLWTTVGPNSTRQIQVRLGIEPTVSFDGAISLNLILQSGDSVPVDAPIQIVRRSAPVLDSLIGGLTTLGGSNFADNAIPLFRSVPVLRRLLSTGDLSGTADNQSLIIFIAPTIVDNADRGGTPFPCGPITGGYVVCPVDQGPDVSGPHFVLSMGLDADVPVADPTNSYQYGFVFDADGNPNNNYVPAAQFPEDFFQGTDRWYFVTYAPGVGWQLFAVSATTPGNPVRIFTDAKIVILGNAIILLVPQSEFPIAAPPFRATAFRHTGDFGENGNFDVSYHPSLGDPLEPYPLP